MTLVMDLQWILFNCMFPTFIQGIYFSCPLLVSGLVLRLLMRIWIHINVLFVNGLASVMGLWVLWWYYGGGVAYFVILCVIVYGELIFFRHHRGMVIGVTSVAFLFVWLGTVII